MHRYHKCSGMATSQTRNLAMAHLILMSSGLLPAAFWKSRQCQGPLRRMGRCCPEHERWAAVSAGVSFLSCKSILLVFTVFVLLSEQEGEQYIKCILTYMCLLQIAEMAHVAQPRLYLTLGSSFKRQAGLLLKQQGVTITHVFTSVLQRAVPHCEVDSTLGWGDEDRWSCCLLQWYMPSWTLDGSRF